MFTGFNVEIDGVAVGPWFPTWEAARAFTIEIEAGTVVPCIDDPTVPEVQEASAPEPQEMDPTRLPKEDR